MTLRQRLTSVLPRVLPRDPDDAMSANEIIDRVRGLLGRDYGTASIRATISGLAQAPGSVVVRRPGTHGYYLRSSPQDRAMSAQPDGPDEELQQEEALDDWSLDEWVLAIEAHTRIEEGQSTDSAALRLSRELRRRQADVEAALSAIGEDRSGTAGSEATLPAAVALLVRALAGDPERLSVFATNARELWRVREGDDGDLQTFGEPDDDEELTNAGMHEPAPSTIHEHDIVRELAAVGLLPNKDSKAWLGAQGTIDQRYVWWPKTAGGRIRTLHLGCFHADTPITRPISNGRVRFELAFRGAARSDALAALREAIRLLTEDE